MIYREEIVKALQKATGVEGVQLDFPSDESYGDFTTNIAMQIAVSDDSRDPKELAKQIIKRLSKDKYLYSIVSKIEVAESTRKSGARRANAFINFWLSQNALLENLNKILEERDDYGKGSIGKGKTVVIDYSSPNIAKRFSIGHLRSTIIGQALYNIYSFLGWKTVGDNHLGDWGTQFGVLIYMVESQGLDPKALTVDDWEKLYILFHQKIKQKPFLMEEARKAFSRLEKGDIKAKEIWQAAYEASIKEYNRIYDRLDIKIDYAYGESFYEDKMKEAIKMAVDKGVAQKSGKALAVEFGNYNLPSNLLVKSDGVTTYLARDLALMIFRKRKWNPDLQIFEVGADQKLYFQQVFALAEMLGLFKREQLKHVAHGMIRFKEGKMSTRQGRTVKLEDVLNEAVERAKKLGSNNQKLAEQVGIGAVKWNDLKRDPETDIVFDWNEVLNMQGNSGPYLQYTYARTKSVLRKAKESGKKLQIKDKKLSITNEEVLLLRSFVRFPEIIITAAKNYSPNLVCNYLYDLAQKFNTFYNVHRIIGSDNEEFRLALTFATGQVLKNGLDLLGIATPEKM